MQRRWTICFAAFGSADGRILQPDKPATAVDSMFAQVKDGAQSKAPPGEVWLSHVSMETATGDNAAQAQRQMTWYYLLSVDVKVPWSISDIDMFPAMNPKASGAASVEDALGSTGEWVAHQWFTGHSPTNCQNGSHAVESGCVMATVKSVHTQHACAHACTHTRAHACTKHSFCSALRIMKSP